MTWRGVRHQHLLRVEGEDTKFTLRVYANEFVGAELEKLGRCLPWKMEHDAYPPLSEDIDLAASELSVIGAYRQERLHRIIGDSSDL
jgi:hypothetical protein